MTPRLADRVTHQVMYIATYVCACRAACLLLPGDHCVILYVYVVIVHAIVQVHVQ